MKFQPSDLERVDVEELETTFSASMVASTDADFGAAILQIASLHKQVAAEQAELDSLINSATAEIPKLSKDLQVHADRINKLFEPLRQFVHELGDGADQLVAKADTAAKQAQASQGFLGSLSKVVGTDPAQTERQLRRELGVRALIAPAPSAELQRTLEQLGITPEIRALAAQYEIAKTIVHTFKDRQRKCELLLKRLYDLAKKNVENTRLPPDQVRDLIDPLPQMWHAPLTALRSTRHQEESLATEEAEVTRRATQVLVLTGELQAPHLAIGPVFAIGSSSPPAGDLAATIVANSISVAFGGIRTEVAQGSPEAAFQHAVAGLQLMCAKLGGTHVVATRFEYRTSGTLNYVTWEIWAYGTAVSHR